MVVVACCSRSCRCSVVYSGCSCSCSEWSGAERTGLDWCGGEWSVAVVVAETATRPLPFAHFWQGAESLAPATRNRIRMSKSVQACCDFNILGFQICFGTFWTSTFKSGPNITCFVHFSFQMCLAPQECALYRKIRKLNFRKGFGRDRF